MPDKTEKPNAVEIVDGDGNVTKEFEIVSERENTAHPGTFIVEVKEVKK